MKKTIASEAEGKKPAGAAKKPVTRKRATAAKTDTTAKPATASKPGKTRKSIKPAARKAVGILLDMPLVPLRGLNVFPHLAVTFDVARESSKLAIRSAMEKDQMVFLSAQKDPSEDQPARDGVYPVGCSARIRQVLELPGSETLKVLVEGQRRARIDNYLSDEPFFRVEILEYLQPAGPEAAMEAARRLLLSAFEDYMASSGRVSPESMAAISSLREASGMADAIATSLNLSLVQRQELLEAIDPLVRIPLLIEALERESRIAEMEKELGDKVRKRVEKGQKEYFLREQMKVIQEELGERDGTAADIEVYVEQLEKCPMPEDSKKRLGKEIERLRRLPPGYPEGSVIRSFLDLVFELPWGGVSEERLEVGVARDVLERDHYGLEKVKERILEYLAVRRLRELKGESGVKGPILCLVGPPGVGKTSIAKSIAEAMGRRYVRMSLGGVRDEAEIRGHRRTYVGAMPGRMINAIRQAGTDNPLILLDEVDKLGADYHGDPSSALLEVLDPEQNNAFRDHYLEIPYDLSKVLFITTANTTETIPQALLDRMEVVLVSGYTEEEKIEIALRFIVPKQLAANALEKTDIRFDRESIRGIAAWYTREAGVRQLEREVARVCRRVAVKKAEKGLKRFLVKADKLEDLLGKKRFRYDRAFESDQVGVATGLAWTAAGGDTLAIEVNVMEGTGKLELTGSLGDVMKESARAAVTFIRSRAVEFGIDPTFAANKDIHVHVPEGATPKDGPSAGITLATAVASALSGRAVRRNVAMTGEITLRGHVLPIGGLKEKVIAAHRAGIDTVLVPEENRRDASEIPATVTSKLKLVFVKEMSEVLALALA
jgi:ATP-dependent Lon protease